MASAIESVCDIEIQKKYRLKNKIKLLFSFNFSLAKIIIFEKKAMRLPSLWETIEVLYQFSLQLYSKWAER